MESQSTAQSSKFIYGCWRTDKPKEEGFSHELLSSDTRHILDQTDLDTLEALSYPGVDTLLKAFNRNTGRIPDHGFLGTRVGDEYEWMTWAEAHEFAEHLSYGFVANGFLPEVEAEERQWKFMGIQAKNTKEWYLVHLANMFQNATTVALYDTLGPDATRFVMRQTEMTTIAVQADQVSKLAQLKIEDAAKPAEDNRMSGLLNLVVFEDEIPQEAQDLAAQAEIRLFRIKEVYEQGKALAAEGKATTDEAGPDSVFMFSYTSGTTGDPKGVKLTHKMILGAAAAVNVRLREAPFTEEDTYISYLPAAHSFEQCLFTMSCLTGTRVGFFGGNVQKLVEDAGVLKPTLFPSVPRLYNRIYGKVQDKFKAATGLKGMLIRRAVASKLAYLASGDGLTHWFYDKLVFGKVAAMLGGRVRMMITGSAPIATEVLQFLKICFSCDIVEGYGMTETSGGSVCTMPGDHDDRGIVGGPVANVKIRLRDIPEMGYSSEDSPPRGEVCIWGPSVTQGYFKNPEKTAEALHGDWICTGDVGMVLDNGALKIIDRAKNIFKLSQGEYIAPEKLEGVYVQSGYVLQCWIYGESIRDYTVGFFVMDPDKLAQYASANGKEVDDALVNDPALIQTVYDDLWGLANEHKFNPLERPKQITLLKDPFTVESDILTPTMKLKRNVAKIQLKDQIEQMYATTTTLAPSKK